MKNSVLIIFSLLTLSFSALAGGGGTSGPTTPPAACNSAAPFCTGTTYDFPNNTGVAELGGGGIYDCLSTTPNPVWYFMQIGTSGNINIDIDQYDTGGTPIDVDFVMWGPFTSVANGCSSISANNVIDCSYDPSAHEEANISNAQTGQFYILLLTNYEDEPGNIVFGQTSGSGSTNCNVLCNMTGLTATPGACDPNTGQYSVTGQIVFDNPPTSGTLTVTGSCGGSVTIPAPWTSPLSYTLPGIGATGGSCSVTAGFSADATCSLTQNYTSPQPCNGCSVTASNNGPVCPGGSVNLSATSIAGATYSWTGPAGFTSSAQNPTGVTPPSAPGTYTYSLTATVNGQPCTSTTSVVVSASPAISGGPNQTVCAGQQVTLSGSGATTYTWDNNVTDGVPFTPAATTTYTVTGTSAGCSGTAQVTVTVNPQPVVSAGNDVTVCEGSPVTLSGGGATTYSWTNNVVNGVPFTPTSTATYTVTGTAGGCSGTDDVTVTVSPSPALSFVPNVVSGCSPLTVTFTNNSGSTSNCQWSFGNGATGTGCSVTTHEYTGTGCYDVTLVASTTAGCVAQVTYPSLICVAEKPVATFMPMPSTLTMLDTYSMMNNTSTGASGYVWDFGDDTPNSTLASPGHSFPSNVSGSYIVTLVATNDYGCVDTAFANVIVEDELIYYVPNSFTPDGDQYNQEFKPVFTAGFDPYDYSLTVYNRWGEIVFESHDAKVGWTGTYGAGRSIAQDGSYTWKIEFKTTKSDERKMISGHLTLIR